MDINDVQLVGGPCGQHGPYTFYKAFRYKKNGVKKIVTLSEFFFVKMWRDSDLLCIGELQLLWTDKNSEQTLASLRLYFLPENTPEGRMDHGEDEVLAISEKVVIRLEDLVTWITVKTEWNWGRLAKCEEELKGVPIDPSQLADPRVPTGISFNPLENVVDLSDVEQEKEKYEDPPTAGTHVVILSFPKYCRYRAMIKRLEGVENLYLKHKIVNALGGFYVKYPNTRVLFCRDTFDYPELEGHELLCNHLAPKLKGRPRGRRKKRSISPESESNESESSITSHFTRVSESSNDVCSTSSVVTRRSTRCHENNENKQFMKMLSSFMKAKHLPMGRVPSLGYKELNLHEFYIRVQKLGGYECVTTNRLWKSIFDDMTGHLNSTSAATIIRRHYERFLLAYERHEKGEEDKPLPISERRRLKSKRAQEESASTDSESGTDTPPSTPQSVSSPPAAANETKEPSSSAKTSSLRSIRVKPERQKEKLNNDKLSAENLTNPESNKESENAVAQIKDEPENIQFIVENTVEKRDEDVKPDDVKIETTVAVKVNGDETTEDLDIKEEDRPKSEPDVVKASVPEGTKTEGSIPAEPATNAVAPVAVTIIPEKTLSPIEGKENIPVVKTGDAAAANATPKMMNDLYSTNTSETTTKAELEDENSIIQNVKRIKLDILKEGGLEVTPIRSGSMATSVKEFRPSVIQPPLNSSFLKPPMAPPSLLTNVLPKRNSATTLPASINITQIKNSTTPVKQIKPSDSFQFLNGATPPKVVQSKSIYSYSEKTVYGNPKDYLQMDVVPHAPRTLIPNARQGGCDPVDLSLTSPQKPVVEIMPVPHTFPATAQTSSYNRASVTKNLYKTTPHLLEGRKLGPNLEITLVNPKQLKYPSPVSHKRSISETCAQKIAKLKEGELSSRQSKYNIPHQMHKSGVDIPSVPSPFGKSSVSVSAAKPDIRHQAQPGPKPPPPPPPPPTVPLPFPQTIPPYLAARFAAPDNANGLNPFLPLMDSLYYQAALQNVYSNLSNMPPMLPIPTPEQLKFYAELMAHGRLGGMPFSQTPEGHSSVNSNKNP